MSTISVCIVTYNSAKYISSCLESVFNQSHPIEKIVVVDNASSDASIEKIKDCSVHSDRFQLIINECNTGFSKGQNQAIQQIDSDYVLVLNPDCILEIDYVSEILKFMNENPRAGSATGLLRLTDAPEFIDSAGLGLKYNRQAFDLGAMKPISFLGHQPCEVFGVSGAAAIYRVAMIKEISYYGEFFDETFFAYKEDVDVSWRAKHFGWQSWYIPSAKAFHNRGWKSRQRSNISIIIRKHSYANRYFSVIKNEPIGWHLICFIPLLLITEIAKLFYILLFEPQLLSAWGIIFSHVPEMLQKRMWLFGKLKEKNIRPYVLKKSTLV